MKEHPILFSDEMVRAILDGRKTQTRRIVDGCVEIAGPYSVAAWKHGEMPKCPYGEPGDRLWVREKVLRLGEPEGRSRWCQSIYSADASPTVADCWPWQRAFLPPMHMPRGLSRITLLIRSIRVERLQGISASEALAEGVTDDGAFTRLAFAKLWDVINGKRAPWSSNPWVWVVGFERQEAPRG